MGTLDLNLLLSESVYVLWEVDDGFSILLVHFMANLGITVPNLNWENKQSGV